MGDHSLKESTNMLWWTGVDVLVGSKGEKLHVYTLYDDLDKMCRVPERPVSTLMRMPISGVVQYAAYLAAE